MNKTLATILATIALLLGSVGLAQPASADCGTPIECLNQTSDTSPLLELPETEISTAYVRELASKVHSLEARVMVAEITANDYRVATAQQAVIIEDLRATVARQAAKVQRQRVTIQRLRARLAQSAR